MQDPSHSCEFHGAIKCAAVLAVAKFFASQNVAKESQFGSVCAHSALPLLRTLSCDARSLTQLRIPWGDQVCSCSRSCKVLCLTKCCQRVPVWLCLCPLCVAVASHFGS